MVSSGADTAPTCRLRLFGRVDLTDASGAHRLSGFQRRPLALLAILATSGAQGIGRDRLLCYLWPESDARHGRNTLNQTLYALRRTLGRDDLVYGTTTLALSANAITCDVWDVERALRAGSDDEAVAQYGGPFLDGFRVPGLAELDQWIEAERRRYALAYSGALERLATAAEARDDPAHALHLWRRLTEASPLSAPGAAGIIRTLAVLGDRAQALDYARLYTTLLRTELDSGPDPTIVALIDRIRRTSVAKARETWRDAPAPLVPPRMGLVPATTVPLSTPTAGAYETGPVASADAPDAAAAGAAGAAGAAVVDQAGRHRRTTLPEKRRRRSPRPLWGAALLAVLVVSGLAIARPWTNTTRQAGRAGWPLLRVPTTSGSGAASTSAAGRVATSVVVLPFQVVGPDSLAGLVLGMMDLLSASLDGADVDVVDPSAVRRWAHRDGTRGPPLPPDAAATGADVLRYFGARAYVTGEVAVVGDRLRLTARWYELPQPGGAGDPEQATLVAHSVTDGERGRLLGVADRTAARLLAARHRAPSERLLRAAEHTTAFPAFKAFLRGERALRDAEDARAEDEFAEAVTLDSTSALAHYRLSVAADRAGHDGVAGVAAARAVVYARTLGDRDRTLAMALAATRRGEHDLAERLYATVVADYPDDVEAWYRLGELLFSTNPLVGRSVSEARHALEQVVRLEPGHDDAQVLLARIAAVEGRRAAADSLVTYLLADTRSAGVLERRALRSFARADRAWLRLWAGTLGSGDPATRRHAVEAAVYPDDPSALRRFAVTLTAPDAPPAVRAAGFRMLARGEAARGRWTGAFAFLDSALGRDPATTLELRALLASLPFLGVPRPVRQQVLAEMTAWTPDAPAPAATFHTPVEGALHRHLRLHRLGLLHAALHDGDRARQLADSLAQLPYPVGAPPATGAVLAQSVRAAAAYHAGRYAETVRILEATPWATAAFAFEIEAHDRFLRADALRALGQEAAAAPWYASMAQRAPYELVYLAPAEARLGEFAERRGAAGAAAQHYRRFVALWADADPVLQPQVTARRRWLTGQPQPAPLIAAVTGAAARGR